jgi:hypothetical protein
MKIRHTMVIIIGLIVVAGLMACQSGKEDTRGETGSVAILLTDGPAADFDQVLVTIDKIELLSEDTHVILFEDGTIGPIDLLQLRNEASLISLSSGIPAGPYSKIRLHVIDLDLVKGETIIKPKLPANGKIDLNPRMTFFVDPGETLVVEIDIDAQKSIHVVETGSSSMHIFRPVVFVKIVDGFEEGKIIKASGVVTDRRNDGFALCNIDSIRPAAPLPQGDDLSKCVDVHIGSSSFFDEQGDPVGYDQIAEGDFITLFGKTHMAAVPLDGPENSPPLEIQAFVVGKGNLLKFTGIIGSSLDGNDQFIFHIDPPGQGLSEDSINVQYWEETIIFSPASDLLDNTSISDGTFATVYGIVDITKDILSAEVILLRETAAFETIAGEIWGNVSENAMTFDLQTDTGTVCVITPTGSQIVMMTQDGSDFEINQAAHIEDLQIGDGVTLFGSYDSANPACFIPDSVFAFRESQG